MPNGASSKGSKKSVKKFKMGLGRDIFKDPQKSSYLKSTAQYLKKPTNSSPRDCMFSDLWENNK